MKNSQVSPPYNIGKDQWIVLADDGTNAGIRALFKTRAHARLYVKYLKANF